MKFHFVPKSGNKKTGFMPVTYNSRLSCPNSCIFKKDNGGGCYAETGYYTRLNWDKVTSGERGGSFKELLQNIKRLVMPLYKVFIFIFINIFKVYFYIIF